MGPLAVTGIGFGVSALSKAFGGGQQGVPSWVIDMIKRELLKDRSGYVPDEGPFMERIQNQIDEGLI